MAEVLSHHDAAQLYTGALFHYKKDLVKIRVYDGGWVTQFNLRTKKASTIQFEREDYLPVTARIGNVNIAKSVVMVVRNTLRNYQISVCPGNIQLIYPPINRPLGMDRTSANLKRLESPELIAAIDNDYPPLEKAYENAIEWESGCAFDKQFTVRHDGMIIYKNQVVGTYDNKCKCIQFTSSFNHLHSLLENCYEKSSRTYRAKPIRG